MENKHRFSYEWSLKDAIFTKDKGKVFSCFACGGGSTMGYKLAGFDVIGCNEIDPKMIEAYKTNHNPKFAFLEPIQTFKLRTDLPDELYNLDILDGSPPCSSFSMAGNREGDWGKEKVFREGQSEQVLDTLFFDFIDLAKKLQPKVVVAENVKGLMMGEAWKYMREIYKQFDDAGYYCQHWLLDASTMGVPQRRERVFFIALRKDLAGSFLEQVDMFNIQPKIVIEFKESEILFNKIIIDDSKCNISEKELILWNLKVPEDNDFGQINERLGNKITRFTTKIVHKNKVPLTITANCNNILYDYPRHLLKDELIKIGTFPKDYDFINNKTEYLIGMSVPPIMVAQIATEIFNQWISKINN